MANVDLSDQELLDKLAKLKERRVAYNNKQTNFKLLLNSLYGATGTQYFRYYDKRIAASITSVGRDAIIFIGDFINDYFKKKELNGVKDFGETLVYGDTDSCYFTLAPIVEHFFMTQYGKMPEDPRIIEDFCDKYFDAKVQPLIDEAIMILSRRFNCVDIHEKFNYFKMSREVIGDRGFFVTKKKYCVRVYNKDGVSLAKPKLKIMGMQMVKRNTPNLFKLKMKEALALIMDKNQDGLIEHNLDSFEVFCEAKFTQIAEIKPANGLAKYSEGAEPGHWNSPHTPSQIRAALRYNHLIQELDLRKKYDPISEGEKFWFFAIEQPNIFDLEYAALPIDMGELPPELYLSDRVRYDKQFDKFYRSIIEKMTDIIGWSYGDMRNVDALDETGEDFY